MRISFGLAIILVSFSGHALAAKGGKKAAPKGPVQTMDSNDPAQQELSEKKAAEVKPETEEEQKQAEARVDAAEVTKTRARDNVGVFGNVLFGFGKAPEPGPAANITTGQTTSATFMVGGHYDLSPEFTLALRLPWTVGSARQIDGSHATSTALGTPELLAEYRVTLSPFTRLPLFVGLGVPVAQGNYDTADSVRQTQLNDVADAASGYRDPELFGPKRLPIIVGGGIDYERKALSLHAATKFVAGVKVGGKLGNSRDASGVYELKSVSFRNVTAGGIAYRVLEKPQLFVALDSWFAISAINPVEYESDQGAAKPTRFQMVFEPRVGARFGKITPSVGYIFPIGGRLADSSVSGLELHCDVAF
jgi:hypothetical protein